VATAPVPAENGGVIMTASVEEVEEGADEVIEEVKFNPNNITLLLLLKLVFYS
jgi:hypothetical protein